MYTRNEEMPSGFQWGLKCSTEKRQYESSLGSVERMSRKRCLLWWGRLSSTSFAGAGPAALIFHGPDTVEGVVGFHHDNVRFLLSTLIDGGRRVIYASSPPPNRVIGGETEARP